MTAGRQNVLVETSADGYMDRAFSVEPVGFAARIGYGLYLMVPVNNAKHADEIAKRLSDTSTSTEAKDNNG